MIRSDVNSDIVNSQYVWTEKLSNNNDVKQRI